MPATNHRWPAIGRGMGLALAVLLPCGYAGPARAAGGEVGVTLYVTAGGTQEVRAGMPQALPVVPLGMLHVEVPAGRFSIFAEGSPPIGPVNYAGGTQATRIGYFASELRYRFARDAFSAGIGTTIVDQTTYYANSIVTRQSSAPSGLRLSASWSPEHSADAVTELRAALTPSMHAQQRSNLTIAPYVAFDDEAASMVDLQIKRTLHRGRYGINYGVRYFNYAAHFTASGRAADRERFIMPFAGFDVTLGR